ncbi:MAG: (2Fe-2S) ferredoxin domain-containing protein [Zoogloeaceae bacterium]|jgi:(2Fe-2S) ferredoxin|nr:(2Fe-2S) ferredoxin domain-containing protein [Zoogloeaceae bacterium]
MSFFKKHLFICTNQRPEGQPACNSRNDDTLFSFIKKLARELGADAAGVRISKAGCLGRCEHAPMLVIYPEAVWYTFIDEEDLEEIIRRHLLCDERVERLLVA